jgi:hypothetical protein
VSLGLNIGWNKADQAAVEGSQGGEDFSGPRPLIYQGIFARIMGSVYQARAPAARASKSETERTGVPSDRRSSAIGVRGQPESSLDPKLMTGRRPGLPPLPHVELQAPEAVAIPARGKKARFILPADITP